MELSIVVCTFNRCSFLKSGLDEIIRQILSINNSDIDITKKYVGFTEIDNEKYDIFKHSFKTNYFGNDPRVKQFLKQNMFFALIH